MHQVYTMGVISIRLPDDVEAVYTRRGVRPSRIGKEFLMQKAREFESEERLERLRKFRRKPSKPIVELLREVRDEP